MTILWHPSTRTERLFLRPLSLDDIEAVHDLRSGEGVREYLTADGAPPTRAEHFAWLENRAWPTKFNFAVLLVHESLPRDSWPLMGIVGCPRGVPEIGYGIHVDYHGQGYATEAVKGMLELYWRFVPSDRLGDDGLREGDAWKDVEGPRPPVGVFDHAEACTGTEHVRSRRVLEKCGFRWFAEREKTSDERPHLGDRAVIYRLERPAA